MDLAGFDLNLLKAFDALYAERHVTRAGQRIGLSQSAMWRAYPPARGVRGRIVYTIANGDAAHAPGR
jgi:hypothetical protein